MVVQPLHGAAVPSTPLRPVSATFSLSSRMKRGGGAGARRALSSLGSNDAQANLRLAESLFTVTQEKFLKKWNFDPVKAAPLAPGRYLWTPVTSSSMAAPATLAAPAEAKDTTIGSSDKDILTCFTLPKSGFTRHHSTEPRVPPTPQTLATQADTVAQETVRTPSTSSVRTPVSSPAQQSPTACVRTPSSSVHQSPSATTVRTPTSSPDNNDSGIETDESISESPVASARPSTTQTTITDYLRCSKKRLLVVDDEDMAQQLPASKRLHQQQGDGSTPTSSTVPAAGAASPLQLHK